MSVKPVDFQIMIPRTNEISKAQCDSRQKEQMTLQQQVASGKQETQVVLEEVHTREKAQKAGIKGKQDKERKDNGKNGKKNKRGYNQNSELTSENDSSVIDVKL